MSAIEKYQTVLENLSRHRPTDIDALLAKTSDSLPPPATLWRFDLDEDISHIGIRISAPLEAPARLVGKMAALAVEKRIVPIFISWVGNCGLQHFGMHVEHIAGADAAACADYEEHLKRMWNLAIIIEADEIMTAPK